MGVGLRLEEVGRCGKNGGSIDFKDMRSSSHRRCAVLVLVMLTSWVAMLQANLNRIEYHDQELFLNGLNLAWDEFANDIGPHATTPDLDHFEAVFNQMQANGGNCMRVWLHTTGAHTPQFAGSTVTGPGEDTIEDLRAILDLAWEYRISMMLCLWSFDMLRKSNGETVTDRARDLLTDQTHRQSYIDNALTPMVTALKGHPAILAWEIFNEPEGMSNEFGWEFNHHVPMSSIQAFVNQCAGAIRRADPKAQVTNGSWSFYASTDVGAGNFNYYTDERLIAAGGDEDGYLDFYTVHYYDWAGTIRSPFAHPASHWALDKPLVVAEFYPDCDNCGDTPHSALLEGGYAGALNWSWTDRPSSVLLEAMSEVAVMYPDATTVEIEGIPTASMASPATGAVFDLEDTVTIVVSADDADGDIASVSITAGSTEIAHLTAAPYEFAWESPPAGTHLLRARVTDEKGLFVRTEPVRIVVTAPGAVRYEAEDAVLAGVTVGDDTEASGGAYVAYPQTGSVTWAISDVPRAGDYSMTVGFNLFYDTPKTQRLVVNGGEPMDLLFDGPAKQWRESFFEVALEKGDNTVSVEGFWGYMFLDYIEFDFSEAGPTDFRKMTANLGPDGLLLEFPGVTGRGYALHQSDGFGEWSAVTSVHATEETVVFQADLETGTNATAFRVVEQ